MDRKDVKMGSDASIIDARGGGLCKIHGTYFGFGRHGLKLCPLCDIEAFYSQTKLYKKSIKSLIPSNNGKDVT